MGKLIVIRLGEGSFKEGFPVVNLQIAEDGEPYHHQPESTSLPADLALHKFYENLNKCYEELEKINYNYPSLCDLYSKCNLSPDYFKEILCKWLNSSDFHNKWYHQICPYFSNEDNIRVVWQIKDQNLAKLPWHLWNFFENYSFAEVAFSLSEYEVKKCYHLLNAEVRILVIDGGGVDSTKDIEEIKKLSPNPHILQQEGVKTICKMLEEKEWDILFFIGHSGTSDNQGILYIEKQGIVTIDKFKNAVNKALGKRLRLAIFNSCHGLGLATTLARWNFPQVIVMRLPISDVAAQRFLQSFIPAFQKGKTLYLALREAREKLQELEENDSNEKSILANWLPVIYDQSFVQRPLTWQSLPITREKPPEPPYIERPPLEQTCYDAIVKPGGLIRIKAPQKMGKTLLLQKALDYARGQGYQTVELTFDQTVLDDYSSFLKWFCFFLGDTLKLDKTIDECWQSDLGIQRNCTKYFEEVLLPSISSELVIAMDEFEILFEFPEIFRKFCPLIRSWYSKARRTDKSSKIWKKLRIVIVYSTQLYPKLDPNHSPLNVGTPINLKGFTQEEVEILVTCRQLEQKFKNQDEYLKLLIKLVDGHPDLIQQALDYLQNENKTIADPDLWKTIFTEQGVFSIYLTEQLENLENNPDLQEAYKKVISEDTPVRVYPQKLRFQLHSLGLIKFVGNDCVPSCDLYHNYFSDILLNNNQRSQQWLSNLQLAGL